MKERDRQFLALYDKYRMEDQRDWYASRSAEFEKAHEQVITINIALLTLAAAAAVLASANVFELRALWAILAVVFPVLSTALSAYDGLYAFERQAKLYQDAYNALLVTAADSPDLRPFASEADFRRALDAYVNKIEGIFQREQGQWGQLISEIKAADAPATIKI